MNNFLKTANIIIEKLEDAGYEAYIVGGAVRDYILNRPVNDIDITTSAPVEMIKILFPHSVNVALNHGTVIVIIKGQTFEVTSYRGMSLDEDLKHRDFTMNALAITKEGQIIDPNLGKKDIEKGFIRGVGIPKYRLKEDPLRMLRAIRFVSQLNFKIEEETFQAIVNEKRKIAKVAIERVSKEFEKLCLGLYSEEAFLLLKKTKVSDEIPQFNEILRPLNNHDVIRKVRFLTNMTEIWSYLLFFGNQCCPKLFLRKWKQPKRLIHDVNNISQRLPYILEDGFTNEDLYFLGIDLSLKAERVRAVIKNQSFELEKIHSQFLMLPIRNKSELAINGKDIIFHLSKEEESKRIGELLDKVEKAVLSKVLNNHKDKIIRWLREEGDLDEE